tara:strand:+ start:467 stop:712 length:246 start_codon:yes stop_codon:yes gene_type:complete
MPHVFLMASLRSFANGANEFVVKGTNVSEIITELDQRFPGIGEKLRSGIAVAIDGEIMSRALYEPVEEDSEVHFLPAVSGG